MNFCYCVGGTGARVAEVAAHLCAMNLVGEEDVTFVIVDKDSNCGGTTRAKEVIQSVAALAAVNTINDVALSRSKKINAMGTKEFCKSNLKVESWDFTKALADVSPKGISGVASLEDSLRSTDLTLRESDDVLLDALYSAEDQTQNTEQGFYGHPSIGALIFKYMVKNGKWDDPSVTYDNDIAAPVKKFLANNPALEARVFIVGSIFGGTGASIFSNLAHHIRNSVPSDMSQRLFLSGALLLPYFKFPPKVGQNSNITIDPNNFYPKSKVALEQYANDPNLFKNASNSDGSFDCMYVCGQNPLHIVSETYSHGGESQKNHFDFVDLAAAKAMTEFFTEPKENITGGKIFEYRYNSTQNANLSMVDFATNTVDMQKPLVAMLAFSAYVITRIYAPFILRADDPYNNKLIRMLYDQDMQKKTLFGHTKEPSEEYTNIVKGEIKKSAERVWGYCKSYVRFVRDLAQNGYDWTGGGADNHINEYNFFDDSYLEALENIATNDITTQNASEVGRRIDAFMGRGDYLPNTNNGITVKSIEDAMEKVFEGAPKKYRDGNTPAAERIADYIHEVFKYCDSKA